jgi:LysR family glycine cleavage system transcriptional activator
MSVSPPRPKGPPLNALRAFEAAARLGGFALAAEELSVTPGAVSQHIRALEDWAGVALFERRAQGVRLTPEGAALAPRFAQAFDAMGEAVRELQGLRPEPVISLAALPSVAQLWLLPRMAALRAAVPGVRLSVTALETPPNLRRELFDLSLFIGAVSDDPQEAARQEVLARDSLVPVAAPVLAEGIGGAADLARATRLHDASWEGDWAGWAEAAGVALPEAGAGPRYSLYALAAEEARHGAGVLLGHRVLIAGMLARGELVTLGLPEVASDAALILGHAGGPKRADLTRLIAALRAAV